MSTSLGELFVEITANTGKLDAALATSSARVAGLSAAFAQTRDDGGRFAAAVGASTAAMAGRYVDAAGRMREANGRFVAGMQGAAAAAAAVRIRPPTIPPPSFAAWLTGVREAAGAYEGFIGPAFARTFAAMKVGLGFPAQAFLGVLLPPAVATAGAIRDTFNATYAAMKVGLGFPAQAFLSTIVPPAAAAARAVRESFAFTFEAMKVGLGFPAQAFLNLVGPPMIAAVGALGREFAGLGGIIKAVVGPAATAAGGLLKGAFGGVAAGVAAGFSGLGGIFRNVIGPAASATAGLISSAFGAALGAARTAIGAVGSVLGGIGSAITSTLGSLKLPGLALAGGAVAGLGFAVKQAADLEQVFSGLRKTTGLTGTDLDKLKDDLKTLAVTMSGVTFNDLAAIATMGGRMGIAGPQLVRFTKDIAAVSIALDDIPAEESATSIARTLNVFKLGSENAIRFASALNKLDDSSTATGRDILDITARIAPTASVLGLSPQKVLAIATALKDAGADNEVAGSSISQIFSLMAKDIDKFAKVAGVSTKEFSDALRGDPLVALQLLVGSIQKMDKIDAFKAVSSLGIDGTRATGTLLQLGSVMGKLGGFVQDANSEWSSTASIQAEVAVQGETTYAILKRLGNVIQIMAAEIGTFALPLVKALATSFGELGAEVRAFIAGKAEGITAFMAPLTAGARNIGLIFSEWPTFVTLAANAFQGLAIQVVTVLGRLGGGAFTGLAAAGTNAVQFLSNAFGAFGAFLADLFTQISANLKAQIEILANDMVGILGGKAGQIAAAAGTAGLAALGPLGTALRGLASLNATEKGKTPPVPPPIVANLGLVSPDKFTAGLKALPSLGDLFGGVFKGLDLKSLAPGLADERAGLLGVLDAARKTKDVEARNRATGAAFRGILDNLTTGGNLADLIPSDLKKRGLDFANRAFGVIKPALDRATAGPKRKDTATDIAARVARNRAAKLKARQDAAAAREKLTPEQRRQKAIADRARDAATSLAARRANVKSPSGAVDILEGIDKTLNSLLTVNKSTDNQLKNGLVAKLGR